jgi:hypothetical protein
MALPTYWSRSVAGVVAAAGSVEIWLLSEEEEGVVDWREVR